MRAFNSRLSSPFVQFASIILPLGFFAFLLIKVDFFEPGTIPSTHRDALEFIWTIWWHRFAIEHAYPLYFTSFLFYPEGSSLLLHATAELLTFPAALIARGISPAQLFSVLCVLAMMLNFITAARLFERLMKSLLISRLLAFAFFMHPYFISHLDGGHLNFLCFFPVILALDRFEQLLHVRGAFSSNAVWFCVSIAALPFLNPYYFYFSVLTVAALSVLSVAIDTSRLKDLPVFLTLLTIASIPASWKLIAMGALLRNGRYTPNHDPSRHSADVLHLIVPGLHQYTGSRFTELLTPLPLNDSEAGLYLGWIAVMTCLVITFSRVGIPPLDRKRITVFAGGFALFVLLSVGPQLQLAGRPLFPTFAYELLAWLLPAFPSVPARFGIMAVLFLMLMVAIVLPHSRRGHPLLPLFIVLGIVVEYFPAYFASAPLPPPAEDLRTLRDCASVRSIADTASLQQRALFRQTIHEKPISGGFLARRPEHADKRVRNNYFLRRLSSPTAFDPDDDRLRESFEKLRADALLIEETETLQITNASLLPWLERRRAGPSLMLFLKPEIVAACFTK